MQFHYACIEIPMHGAPTAYTVADTTNPTDTKKVFPVSEDEYDCLVDGGYVVDLRPLVGTPNEKQWVPCNPSGKLDDGELTYLLADAKNYANQLLAVLNGEMLATDLPKEPVLIDDTALYGEYSSVKFYALAWASRGAKIGMRQGNTLWWIDGTSTPIPVTQ